MAKILLPCERCGESKQRLYRSTDKQWDFICSECASKLRHPSRQAKALGFPNTDGGE